MRHADDGESSCHAWRGSEEVTDQRGAEEAGGHDEDLQHLTSVASPHGSPAVRSTVKLGFLRSATWWPDAVVPSVGCVPPTDAKGAAMTAARRVAQGLMVFFGLLPIMFYSSVYASTGEDVFPDEANALIATAGVALGVLVIVLATAGISSGERWAWLALWVLPVFFLAHAILLGTWVPDGVLAALGAAALIVTRPRHVLALPRPSGHPALDQVSVGTKRSPAT